MASLPAANHTHGGCGPVVPRDPSTHVQPDTLSPDPDATLVLYHYHADHQRMPLIVEDLMLKCKVNQYEVKGFSDPRKPS